MKKRTIRRLRRTLASITLVAAMAFSVLAGQTARAEDVTVPSTGSEGKNVTATFTIDDDTLASLGYSAVASIPVSMTLSYNSSSKLFTNSGTVYCSGVLDSGKKVSVTVNESGEKYGKVYDSTEAATSVVGKTGFSVSLSKTAWSKSECQENLTKINNSEEATKTGTLTISVPGKGFIPSGTGTFKTYAPLAISMTDA
ncbi:MAG: hypothetical protein IJ679_01150 [Lachnospiraceae bacterium]|nr:hypothetical protein [Lachnospiraceae bacterium]